MDVRKIGEHRVYSFREPDLHGSKKTLDPAHNLAFGPTLVMKRDVAGALHLWRDGAVRLRTGFVHDDNSLFMSDALFADAMTQGLQGLAASHHGVFDTDKG